MNFKNPLIIANWKVNPNTLNEAIALAKSAEQASLKNKNIEVAIAPPFPFITEIASVLKKSRLAAQDCFYAGGAYTGEVSWPQLKSLGVEYVILGHSERRSLLQEKEEMINKKVQALLKLRAKVILCVGEKKREEGFIPEVVGEQLKSALAGIKKQDLKNLIVAYEPIWAISTTENSIPDTPESAFQSLIYLRKKIAGLYDNKTAREVRIIYGGSVNSKNIKSFIKEGRMEGALVGGASLHVQEFAAVIQRASAS